MTGRARAGERTGDRRVRRSGPRPAISVAVLNYNGRDVLPGTLRSLEAVRGEETEIVVVDDGSSDGSPEWVEEHHPDVRVVRMGRNTARLNRVRNVALEETRHRYVFLTDNDVRVEPGCLGQLLDVMLGSGEKNVLCCIPRLVYHDDPGRVYHDGGGLHFLCVSTAVPRGEPVEDLSPSPPRPTIGGGIMLIDRKRSEVVGGFDEGYLMGWGDDGEFHVRGRLAGLEVLQVSTAVARHVERQHGTERALAQVYNRYRLLLTAYSGRTLALLAPALLAFEIGLTAAAAIGGFLGERVTALRMAAADLPEFRIRRREIQSGRRVPDRQILSGGGVMAPPDLSGSRWAALGTRALTTAVDLYWRAVRRWV